MMYPSIVRSAVALLFEFCAAFDVSPMNAMLRTNTIDVNLSESLFISFLHFMFDKLLCLSLSSRFTFSSTLDKLKVCRTSHQPFGEGEAGAGARRGALECQWTMRHWPSRCSSTAV